MKNESILHIRMPEDLHSRLNEEASKKGVSVSSLIRDILSYLIITNNPYHSTDLLFVFAYLEQGNHESKDVCEYEVRHLLDIINKHYPNLERGLQLLFDNVITGLEEVIEYMINDEDKMSGSVSFGDGESDIKVDFNKFYELTNGRLPYR